MKITTRQLRTLIEAELKKHFDDDIDDAVLDTDADEDADEFHGEEMTREDVIDALQELLDHMMEDEDFMPHPEFLHELGEVHEEGHEEDADADEEADDEDDAPEDEDEDEDVEDDSDEDEEDDLDEAAPRKGSGGKKNFPY